MINMDVPYDDFRNRLLKQLKYVSGYTVENVCDFDELVTNTISDIEATLIPCRIKQTKNEEGETVFSTMHIGQYACFLWYLGRRAYEKGDEEMANYISYLNSSVNSIFLNHKVDMPKHFYLDHPLGTIIGSAIIGDYFFCLQGCTVGAINRISDGKVVFPVIGNHVEMLAGSSIIGDCKIGDYVILAQNSVVKNKDIPDNSIVFGQDRNIIIKRYHHEEMLKHMVCY